MFFSLSGLVSSFSFKLQGRCRCWLWRVSVTKPEQETRLTCLQYHTSVSAFVPGKIAYFRQRHADNSWKFQRAKHEKTIGQIKLKQLLNSSSITNLNALISLSDIKYSIATFGCDCARDGCCKEQGLVQHLMTHIVLYMKGKLPSQAEVWLKQRLFLHSAPAQNSLELERQLSRSLSRVGCTGFDRRTVFDYCNTVIGLQSALGEIPWRLPVGHNWAEGDPNCRFCVLTMFHH